MHTPAEGTALLGKLTEAAAPGAVYGEPIQQDDTTVITANSVSVGLGFGMFGFVLGRTEAGQEEHQQARREVNGGGGGGGSTKVRPVTVVSIDPEGIKVIPVINVNKIVLAFLSTISAVLIAIHKVKK